jgi:hypothetical protein
MAIAMRNVRFDPKRTLVPFQNASFCRYDVQSLVLGEAMRRHEFITLLGGVVLVEIKNRGRPLSPPRLDIKTEMVRSHFRSQLYERLVNRVRELK